MFPFQMGGQAVQGTYKSRFTCADVTECYTQEQGNGLNVFIPTPTGCPPCWRSQPYNMGGACVPWTSSQLSPVLVAGSPGCVEVDV